MNTLLDIHTDERVHEAFDQFRRKIEDLGYKTSQSENQVPQGRYFSINIAQNELIAQVASLANKAGAKHASSELYKVDFEEKAAGAAAELVIYASAIKARSDPRRVLGRDDDWF